MESAHFVEQADPQEVFGLLSNDTRIEILRALGEQKSERIPFSELHDAVSIRDSGQFNYHLDKLVGPFVRSEETGYELTRAGMQIIGAIEAGSYTMTGSIEPLTLDENCRLCGGTRTLRYENETIRVECDTCPIESAFGVPPSVLVDQDRESIPDAAGQYLRTLCEHVESGFCWNCDNPITGGLEFPVPDDLAERTDEIPDEIPDRLIDEIGEVLVARYECERCGIEFVGGLQMMSLSHPAVAGFHYDHGVDTQGSAIWRYATFSPDHERAFDRDPLRARVRFVADGDELALTIDETLAVVDVDRN